MTGMDSHVQTAKHLAALAESNAATPIHCLITGNTEQLDSTEAKHSAAPLASPAISSGGLGGREPPSVGGDASIGGGGDGPDGDDDFPNDWSDDFDDNSDEDFADRESISSLDWNEARSLSFA